MKKTAKKKGMLLANDARLAADGHAMVLPSCRFVRCWITPELLGDALALQRWIKLTLRTAAVVQLSLEEKAKD